MEGLTYSSEEIVKIPEIKALIKLGKKQGELSYDDVHHGLPENFITSEQMDSLFILLEDMNIDVVSDPVPSTGKTKKAHRSNGTGSLAEDPSDRNDSPDDEVMASKASESNDDPIKVYLKEIGKVSLLSAEEEFNLSEQVAAGEKRIKAVLFTSKYTIYQLSHLLEASIDRKNDIAQLFAKSNLFHLNSDERKLMEDDFIRLKTFLYQSVTHIDSLEAEIHPLAHGSAKRKKLQTLKETHIRQALMDIEAADLCFAQLVKIAYQIEQKAENLIDQRSEMAQLEERSKNTNDLDKEKIRKKIQSVSKTVDQIQSELGEREEEIKRWNYEVKKGKQEITKAKDELVQANLRLVISIAKRYGNRGVQFFDLVQEGNIGLIKAVDRFKYRKGYRFSTYASWWIKQAITKSLSDQSRMIRVPLHISDQIKKVMKESRSLLQTLGRDPSVEELAERLGWPPEKVKQTHEIAMEPVSLEAPVGDDETCLIHFIEDKGLHPTDYNASFLMLKEQLGDILSALPDREKAILKLRFGLVDGHHYTLREAGQMFNLTRERVRQIEVRALKRLREFDRSQWLKDYLIN